jgi:hypothetical protein
MDMKAAASRRAADQRTADLGIKGVPRHHGVIAAAMAAMDAKMASLRSQPSWTRLLDPGQPNVLSPTTERDLNVIFAVTPRAVMPEWFDRLEQPEPPQPEPPQPEPPQPEPPQPEPPQPEPPQPEPPQPEREGTAAEEQGPVEMMQASRGPDVSAAPDSSTAATKRKRGRKLKQQRKKARTKEEEAQEGYTLTTRGAVRAAGGVVAIGDDRTCLPDALWVMLHLLGVRVSQQMLRAALHATLMSDPNIAQARDFCITKGVSFEYKPALCLSPAGLFRQREGAFLVVLELVTPGHTVDYHAIAYDAGAGRVLDNEPGGRVPVVDDDDRISNQKALLVFKQLFPRALKIMMTRVYKAENKC